MLIPGNGSSFPLTVHIENGPQQPIGKAPEIIVRDRVGREEAAGKHLYIFMQAGILKQRGIQPDCSLNLACRQLQRRGGGQCEEERLNNERAMSIVAGSFLIKTALQLVRGEEDAGFFLGLPDTGGEEVFIAVVFPAAGKGKMA